MNENNINKEVIETARLAWNQLSVLMDDQPILFSSSESGTFKEFYRTLITTLFEEETRE